MTSTAATPAEERAPPSALPELRASYRLQLTPQFGFAELAATLPYLAQLGVSHVYVSPCLEAVPDSMMPSASPCAVVKQPTTAAVQTVVLTEIEMTA